MAEEQKNSSAETVDAAASAAHTVKGAIKAGKAISGAAKGAAAGGPYGAVAGAVWAGRKHIGKIIAIIAILLLLPVLFLLMLPGLIFGGLVNAFSPADPDTPILNSETAIVENANDITFAINAILGEALDDVMARIEVDFASSGADKMEVKNPYSSGLVYNANLIVSQYCAARDEDFESISLDDLSTVLRENKEHLYSYTSVRESREVTSEDPETGEETTSTEIWMVYTIRYNGESYLADHVFALTDEQKELASDYASRVGAAHRCIAIPRFSFVRLYIAVPLPLRVVCHKSKAMEEEFFFCQPFQNCQLCTGNFGIDTIFVNVSASIDNIVFCVVYISVIAQAIQRVLSTVKAIMSAVGLFRYIESHPELVTSANQAGKKSFICNHAAPPLTCLCHAEIQQR